MEHLNLLVTMTAVLGVLGYYLFLWIRSGSHRRGPLVIQYSPPRNLSPAMLRYIWKESFDDRTFWACILSLASKGLVTLESGEGNTFVRKTGNVTKTVPPAGEEKVLLNALFHRKKRECLGIDDAAAAAAIGQVAQELRKAAVGKWFSENRKSIIVGALLSLAAICVAANPQSIEQLGALGLAMCFMAPGGYYLFFVLLRLADLVRVARGHFEWAVFSQVGLLLFLMGSCIVSLGLGSVVLAGNSSLVALVVTGFLVALNVGSLLWLRMPTKSGQELLDAIDGFREFLKSVERLPMDRPDAPGVHAGLYEKYLPYAVALEVEQSWSDKFVAANSSYHEHEFQGMRPFYLGMWDGKPVEVAFRAHATGREY